MRNVRGRALFAWIVSAVATLISIINAATLLLGFHPSKQPGADVSFALLPILFAIPAALIITRQPGNTIGWLLLIDPLVEIPDQLFTLYFSSIQAGPPPSTLANLFMAWFASISWMAMIFPILLVPLFFPTGRLISPRWRWAVFLAIAMTLFLMVWGALSRTVQMDFVPWAITNPYGLISDSASNAILPPWSILLAVLTVASVASMVVRYRRGALVERQQMKWLLYACCLFGLIYIPSVLLNANGSRWAISLIAGSLLIFALAAIPAAITAAILRYHLFDIDVIIRQTLVYAIVTALLGLVYAGGVVLMQQAFRALTGQSSDLAVVVTTLAIAVLFNPLRQRVQAFINRRFYREKYDAEKALAEFAVAARSGSDLDALAGMLEELVGRTLQPTEVMLYLHGPEDAEMTMSRKE